MARQLLLQSFSSGLRRKLEQDVGKLQTQDSLALLEKVNKQDCPWGVATRLHQQAKFRGRLWKWKAQHLDYVGSIFFSEVTKNQSSYQNVPHSHAPSTHFPSVNSGSLQAILPTSSDLTTRGGLFARDKKHPNVKLLRRCPSKGFGVDTQVTFFSWSSVRPLSKMELKFL